ncbi:MAG: acyltransferase [Clostridia bacterium]|nr:acyltransferase [Clostridia bacterium]
MDAEVMRARLQKIIRTIWLKIRHPFVKTNRHHLVRPDTEILLRKGGKLSLGKNVCTYRGVTFSVFGGVMRIGENVSFNRNNVIVCMKEISIGDGCAFGPNVVIYDHDHRFSDQGFSTNEYKCSPVVIEDHVWVGANSVILRGAHIGRGSVIGAGTVVHGSIPAYSLVKGKREMEVEPLRRK